METLKHQEALWGGMVGTVAEITDYLETAENRALARLRPSEKTTRKVISEAIMDALATRRKRRLIILEGIKYDLE